MKHCRSFTSVSLVLLAAATAAVRAAPIPRASTAPAITDDQILNFALTLEHLESAFYAQGLSNYSYVDFERAGFPAWVRDRYAQVAQHEAGHVEFLEMALGEDATKACQYKFPVTDAKSFVDVSYILEGVGTAAYTGAASFIENKAYLKAAATILAVEGRHDAWIGSAVKMGSAWSTAYETPLDPNQAYTLASSFITSCPSSNPSLPVHAFPSLALTIDGPSRPGTTLELSSPALTTGTSTNSPTTTTLYAGFLNGQNATLVPLDDDLTVTIPEGLLGTVYVVVTNSSTGVDDGVTVAGPAILDLSFDSRGQYAPARF